MDTQYYLRRFQQIAAKLDKQVFDEQQLEYKAGIWLNSVVLKFQKASWLNSLATAKPFSEGVFCSIWINDETLSQGCMHYNIHALKLRELTNYRIKSRDFAEAFRTRFKSFEKQWPNVSTNFGPLTLMEGRVEFDETHFGERINDLAHRFLAIAFIIDELLAERRNSNIS